MTVKGAVGERSDPHRVSIKRCKEDRRERLRCAGVNARLGRAAGIPLVSPPNEFRYG